MAKEIKSTVEKLFKEKKFLEILELFKSNQKKFKNDIFLLEGLCLSNFNLGNNNEALKSAKKIISLKENHVGAHHVIARVLASKNIDESIQYYKKLLKLSNENEIYLTEYAGLLFSLGVYKEPIEIFKKLLNNQPKNISIKISLARIYIENHDYKIAIDLLEEILKTDKFLKIKHEILNLIGTAYHNQGDYNAANKYYEKSIATNKLFIQSYLNLAVSYQEIGDFEKSRKVLDNANKIKKNAEAYRLISASKKFIKEEDLDILGMLSLNSSSSLKENERGALYFGLGKAYEDLKKYDLSSKYYLDGNNIRRKEFKNYDFEKEIEIMSGMKKIFNESYYKKFSNMSEMGKNLIFIVGMPRSGTTLLEQILSSHKDILGAGELNFFTSAMDHIFQVFDFENFKNKIFNLKKEEIINLGCFYVSKINIKVKSNSDNKYIIDKNPLNFKNIPLIFSSLPKAKIIHIRRGQNDNCLSIYKNFFYHNVMPWSYSQEELKNYYNNYKNYMDDINQKIPKFIFNINYEDLILNVEKNIKDVLGFLNLDWDPNCLEFYKNKRSVRTASISQVRQKIYQTSKDSWKNYKEYFSNLFV